MDSRILIKKIIKYAFENKEARDYLLPIIKENFKEVLKKEDFTPGVLNELGRWHNEKYGSSRRYPSLVESSKSVSFNIYLKNYFNSSNEDIKKEARKTIKKAYIEFEKEFMAVPLKEVIRVAYENKLLRKTLMGMVKKAYAEEEKSIEKGFISRKTWELMNEWYIEKHGDQANLPSLIDPTKKVKFTTYQNYYFSGDTANKEKSLRLVQQLYPAFKQDWDKSQKNKEEEEKNLKKEEEELKVQELHEEAGKKRQERIKKKIDRMMDYMERSVHTIDGELFVKKLDLSEEDQETANILLDNTVKDMSEVIKNRMNNVQDYEEVKGLAKIADAVLTSASRAIKKETEKIERFTNTAIQGIEFASLVYNKRDTKKQYESLIKDFEEADENEKDNILEKAFEENINLKHIRDSDLKIFDNINKLKEEIEELKDKEDSLKNKNRIKRLLNTKKTLEDYVLKQEEQKIEVILKDENLGEEKRKQYKLILQSLKDQGETLLTGAKNIEDEEGTKVEYDASEEFKKIILLEEKGIKKRLGDLFDVIKRIKKSQVDTEKEELEKQKKKIINSLTGRQIDKDKDMGKFEIEELFDRVPLVGSSVSDFVSLLDSYLDDKYIKNENKEVRDSQTKYVKVIASKMKKAFKEEVLIEETNPGSDNFIANDNLMHNMKKKVDDGLKAFMDKTKDQRKSIVEKMEKGKEKIISKLDHFSGVEGKGDLLYETIKTSISGVSERPIKQMLEETLGESAIDLSMITIKETGLLLASNTALELSAKEFLKEKLKNQFPIEELSKKSLGELLEAGSKEVGPLIDHLKEGGNIGELMNFFLKGANILSGENPISNTLKAVTSSISDYMPDIVEEGSFFDDLLDHFEGSNKLSMAMEFVGGGLFRAIGTNIVGNVIDNYFSKEYYDLYDDSSEKLTQELYNKFDDKNAKDLEESYVKKVELLEESLLTDEEWVEKYRGQKSVKFVPGKLWGTNEEEFEITNSSQRGIKRKESNDKAKEVFNENSDIYYVTKDHKDYKELVKKLKQGKSDAIGDLTESQFKWFKKALEDKGIKKKDIKELEELYELSQQANLEGHSLHDPSLTREKVIEDLHSTYKEYDTIAKFAMFRSLYLQGRRNESGEKVTGYKKYINQIKRGSENQNKIPLIDRIKTNIIGLTLKQKIDKEKLKYLKNETIQKTFRGEEPLDKTSFELSKIISKKNIQKYST